jgi:hypothetical protein
MGEKTKMISKIYNSNQILFKSGSRKGKTKEQIALMVEKRKQRKYQDLKKQKVLRERLKRLKEKGLIK